MLDNIRPSGTDHFSHPHFHSTDTGAGRCDIHKVDAGDGQDHDRNHAKDKNKSPVTAASLHDIQVGVSHRLKSDAVLIFWLISLDNASDLAVEVLNRNTFLKLDIGSGLSPPGRETLTVIKLE